MAVAWQPELESATARYAKLDKIRYLAQSYDLLVQEEARPIASALFSNSSLIFHLGFDQSGLATSDWYRDSNHPYIEGIVNILDELASWQNVQQLQFLLAAGDDPMIGLQVNLDRQIYPLSQKPSQIRQQLESQTIYSFLQAT